MLRRTSHQPLWGIGADRPLAKHGNARGAETSYRRTYHYRSAFTGNPGRQAGRAVRLVYPQLFALTDSAHEFGEL